MSHVIGSSLFFLFIIKIKQCSLSIISEKQRNQICNRSNIAEISNYTYLDFHLKNPNKGNEENLLSMIFLNEEGNSKYNNQYISKYDKITIILFIVFIISFIIFIDFNIHFFCKIKKMIEPIKRNRSIDKNRINEIKKIPVEKISKSDIFFGFFKISPFCWVNYFYMEDIESKLYFKDYENKKLTKINIKMKYILSIISSVLFLLTLCIALINVFIDSGTQNALYNLSCNLIILLNKLMDGYGNFAGLNKANEFFVSVDAKNEFIDSYKKEFNNTYYKLQKKFSEWNSFLKEINRTLSDRNSMEFFFYNYPSTPYYATNTNLSECTQTIYEFLEIYCYYPLEHTDSHLYLINSSFFNNFDEVIKNLNGFEKKFIQANNSKILLDENGLLHQIIEKSYQIVELYTQEFLLIYIPEIYDDITNNYLPLISYMDIIILVFIISSFICFIFFNLYLFSLLFMKDRLFIAILLFLLLFFLNFICTFEFIKIQKIKQKINYVEDISNGIYFLFNENNLNYYEDKLDTYIKNISLAVNINNNTKNVLYYLNQIINNNGNITNLFPIDTSISKKNEIDEFYIKFNKTSLGILNQVYVNQPLDKIKKYINNLVNNGLSEYSPFENINRTDSRQKRYETPMSYFSIINGRLEKTLRKQYSYADFNCNEYWDIYPPSQSPEIYVYLPKSEAITNNHYTNHNKPRILNWVEWDFSEIMERYSI